MDRFQLVFLWMLLFTALPAWAQTGTVQGTVHSETGDPLPGINIVLQRTSLGAATDVEGRYVIDRVPVGTHTVRASAIGFHTVRQSITIAPNATVTLDFVLSEDTIESDEIVVTAARRAQRFEDVPVSISVVRPQELEARNIVSLDEALRYVPGVQMTDNQVNIRGSSGFSYNTGSRVLLLLDGMPLLTPDSDGVPHDALPLSQIARVEVLKGPGSALYGNGALGGIINVITKDFPETPETALTLFGGAYQPVRYAVWREQWDEGENPRPFGGFTFTHARRFGSNGGGWLNVAYRADEGFTNFRTERDFDAFFKMGWRPAPVLNLNLLGGWTRRKSDSFLYWNGLRDPLNPGQLSFGGAETTGTSDNQSNVFSLMSSIEHALSASLYYTVKARLIGVVIQPLDDDGSPKPVDEGTAGLRYGGEVQVNWLPRVGTNLTAGVTGDALATASSLFQPDDEPSESLHQPERAAFVQAEQRLFDRIDLVAGLRYDTYQIDTTRTERKLSPKLNAALSLTEGLTLRLAYGQGFRVPSLPERFVDDQSYLPVIPNLALLPEESTSYEAGLRATVPLTPRFTAQADAAIFWNDYDGLVEPTFIPQEQAFQFINLTEARIRGLEASAEAASRDDRWRLGLSYTLLDAKDLTTDQALGFRSRHLLKTFLMLPLYRLLSAGVDYRYASAPDRVDSDFARFVRDAQAIGPTHVVDARIGARWQHWGLALIAKNALDYYYVERPAILAPPRHFMVQLQAQF